MAFGQAFKKAGFGGGKKFGGGGNDFHKGGGDFNKGNAPRFGEDQDEDKKFTPPAGGMGGDDEGGDEDKGEMKPESDKEEGQENETIEQIVALYDQLTPLIDKLRKS